MATEDIAKQLEHYLKLYAINKGEDYLAGIITFAGMLAGRVTK